jgi:NTE family protein
MDNNLLEKSYGLVFEGGGAKGAYEIGVWKALKELNIKIEAVVGTSVGSLNGALFAQGDYEKALDIWENIRYSSIINVEDKMMENLTNFKWNQMDVHESSVRFFDILKNRGLDITPLKSLLDEMINEDLLRNSQIDFGLVTFNLSELKPMEIMVKDIEPGQVAGYLLASSYLPSFRREKIFGKNFLDGAFYNVTPTSMLIERGYKNIIEVRIQGIGLERKVDDSGVNIIRISARDDLGRILEFNQAKSKRNINLGYYDTLRVFKGYIGDLFYIESNKKEPYFLKRFIMIKRRKLEKIMLSFGHKNIYKAYSSKERIICEELIPTVVKKLKLNKNASYQDIYILLIEKLALELNVNQFRIYTLIGLRAEINKELNKLSGDDLSQLLKIDILIELAIALGV